MKEHLRKVKKIDLKTTFGKKVSIMIHDDLVEVVHQRPRGVPVRPNHQACCSLLYVYMVSMMVKVVDNYENCQKCI